MDIDEAIDAAEALADYALLQKISLPAGVEQTLRSARGRKAQYLAPGIPRNDFFAAVGAAQVAISLSPAALLSAQARRHRLQPIVADAQALLGYAAANAHKIDDTTRQVLIAKADAIERGIPTVEDEQAFFKAYEQLTVATAPVTAETLIASNTVLPSLAEFFSKKDFSKSFEKLTLGRFADAIVFILVLLLTGVILGYHSQGSQGLSRVRELDTSIAKLAADVATNADAMDQREQTLRAAVGRNPPVQEQIDAAQKAVSESRRLLASAKQQLEQSTSERSELRSEGVV